MTNFESMNKEEIRQANNHKLEYTIKGDVYEHWGARDILGTKKAIEWMKRDRDFLKLHNPNSEYLDRIEKFIEEKEKEAM